MAKKARVWTGTEFVELASAQTDLTAYSTTAQMNTAITAGVGLVPILTQTIGTAVSSVTVTNAFSATYDSYKILITGGVGSADTELQLQMGATTTGYADVVFGANISGSTAGPYAGGTSRFNNVGVARSTNGLDANIEMSNPFLAKNTYSRATRISTNNVFWSMGYLANTTSYTDFTISPLSGTLTGGTIRVYGYKN